MTLLDIYRGGGGGGGGVHNWQAWVTWMVSAPTEVHRRSVVPLLLSLDMYTPNILLNVLAHDSTQVTLDVHTETLNGRVYVFVSLAKQSKQGNDNIRQVTRSPTLFSICVPLLTLSTGR